MKTKSKSRKQRPADPPLVVILARLARSEDRLIREWARRLIGLPPQDSQK